MQIFVVRAARTIIYVYVWMYVGTLAFHAADYSHSDAVYLNGGARFEWVPGNRTPLTLLKSMAFVYF